MNYIDELIALGMPAADYAVFGSGPLAIRGLRQNDDIDIIARPGLWAEIAARFPENTIGEEAVEIKIGHVSIFKDWLPWFEDSASLIDTADVFDGVRFVNLDNVLAWKKSRAREKDKIDIELINEYLRYEDKS